MKSKLVWIREEPGWYCSVFGGICQERDTLWYFYPITDDKRSRGFKTLKKAQEFVERIDRHD